MKKKIIIPLIALFLVGVGVIAGFAYKNSIVSPATFNTGFPNPDFSLEKIISGEDGRFDTASFLGKIESITEETWNFISTDGDPAENTRPVLTVTVEKSYKSDYKEGDTIKVFTHGLEKWMGIRAAELLEGSEYVFVALTVVNEKALSNCIDDATRDYYDQNTVWKSCDAELNFLNYAIFPVAEDDVYVPNFYFELLGLKKSQKSNGKGAPCFNGDPDTWKDTYAPFSFKTFDPAFTALVNK